MKIGEVIKDGDFKAEKHVPTIEAPEKVKAGEEALVKVMVGQEIKHPNTPLHHISWIQLYFKPEGAAPVVEVARFNYSAHDDTMNLETPGCVAAAHLLCAIENARRWNAGPRSLPGGSPCARANGTAS